MKKIILFLIAIGFAISSFANNLQITGIAVDQTAKTVTFNISWDNSWNVNVAPFNYDAVWVFVKWRLCSSPSTQQFTHGNLSPTLSDHTLPGMNAMTTTSGTDSQTQGSTLDDSTGIMLTRTRTSFTSGSFSANGVILKVPTLPAAGTNVTVHVEGIEMVYVPSGTFSIGDGDGINGSYYRFLADTSGYANGTGGTAALPMSVTGESVSTFWYANSTAAPTNGGTAVTKVTSVPTAWPKGYNGFYMMKYEISQGQYVEFLNTIAGGAQAQRYYAFMAGTSRCSINSVGNNVYTADRPDRAMNWLGWGDYTAYLDWACLRPFTELEFEKACRGTDAPIAYEYAWHTTAIQATTTIKAANGENGTENALDGNCNYTTSSLFTPTAFSGGDASSGPLRCGIYATSVSTRQTSGASFYGIMELSGNLKEYVIALHSTGASNVFTRSWGDGTLNNTTGELTGTSTSTWPFVANGVASGQDSYATAPTSSFTQITGQRGGDWSSYGGSTGYIYHPLRVSDRNNIFNFNYSRTSALTESSAASGGGSYAGGRGAR